MRTQSNGQLSSITMDKKKRILDPSSNSRRNVMTGSGKLARNHTYHNMRNNPQNKNNAAPPPPPSNAAAGSFNARRCTSDIGLSRGRRNSGNLSHEIMTHKRNATILMGQRSNASGVKELVSSLLSKAQSQKEAPLKECAMLAQIANDAYYRVVIGTAGGIEAIIAAMHVFSDDAGIQEAACAALGRLCERNGSNQALVERSGGVQAIVGAMRSHTQNIGVQSEACEALKKMSALIISYARAAGKQVMPELLQLLQHAKVMYITPSGRASAEQLLTMIKAEK